MESLPSLKAPCSGTGSGVDGPGSDSGSALSLPLGLGLLRSCGSVLSPDLVGYYAPWVPRTRGEVECPCPSPGEVVDLDGSRLLAVPPSVLYPALRGLVDLQSLRREDAFPLGLPLTPLASLAASYSSSRRPRSEKKPTPEDQKDQRYLERRRRNNKAAKKSRDARRAREDQIALRAALLEHENAMLRAQLLTLREEAQSLRQLLLRPGR